MLRWPAAAAGGAAPCLLQAVAGCLAGRAAPGSAGAAAPMLRTCQLMACSWTTAWPAQLLAASAPPWKQQQQQQWAQMSTAQQQPRPAVGPDSVRAVLRRLMQRAKEDKPPRADPPPLEPRTLQFESRRSGVIAIKAGMTQEWDEYGVRVPLTVLWIDDCLVLRHKTQERDGVTALVLSSGSKKPKQLAARRAGEFVAWGAPLGRTLWECRVTPDALLPPGTRLTAAHFVAGQRLDVTGVTKGKGFAGVMKRWNFSGQGASHGNTKHHRAPGAIGGRTDPGRVWKGKKMAGRLGGEQQTLQGAWVYKVDPARNLLYLRGALPGPQGSALLLRDAFRWRWPERQAAGLPFPTHLGGGGGGGADAAPAPATTVAVRPGADPYLRFRQEIDYSEAKWSKTD